MNNPRSYPTLCVIRSLGLNATEAYHAWQLSVSARMHARGEIETAPPPLVKDPAYVAAQDLRMSRVIEIWENLVQAHKDSMAAWG